MKYVYLLSVEATVNAHPFTRPRMIFNAVYTVKVGEKERAIPNTPVARFVANIKGFLPNLKYTNKYMKRIR